MVRRISSDKKKLLILYICFLIVTIVPASAVETSSIIAQKTEDINGNQASIMEDKAKISEDNDAINYHVNIIRDTIDGMNSVKWYQFWKWNFYINEGPQRIQDESKIVETLSTDLGKISEEINQTANTTINTGNTSLEIGIDAANKFIAVNIPDNFYNSGDAKANVYLIATQVSSKFNTNYFVSARGELKKGDLVQYPTQQGTYIYLEYIGLNPKGNTVLFLGDSNTAVRLPVSSLNNIKYKIQSATSTETHLRSLNNSKTPKNQILNTAKSQSTLDSLVLHYIATIQEDGLKSYNKTGVDEYNNQINDKTDTRTTGSNLMIAGGVIGAVSLGMWTVIHVLIGFSAVCYTLTLVIPAFAEGGVISTAIMGILVIIAGVLAVTSAALLCTGGGIYAGADSKIDDLNGDKNTFIKGCNAVENELKTYNNGAVNILPVSHNLLVDAEQNSNTTGVLNATDDDGDGLIYSLVGNPSHGKVSVNSNGTYTYTPNTGYYGNDSFSYNANDGYGNSNVATVHVIVHPFNHPPISANMVFDIETNTTLSAQLKATDQDGDIVTYILNNGTYHGNITINSDGTFTYTPLDGFIGNDTFTYVAKDWKEKGNIATVHVNVHPVNHLPVTEDMNLRVAKNENITCKLLATDTDGDNLLYKLVGKPSKGTINLNSDGTFTYIPKKNFVGKDLFTFKANDWQGESGLGTVNMEVYEFNHPPVANNMAINMVKNRIFQGLFNATDRDDDKLTYQIRNNPKHGTVKIRLGKFVYTPINGFVGHDSFTYQAYDGKNQSNIATVKITVSNIIPNIKKYQTTLKNQNTENNLQKNMIKQQKLQKTEPNTSGLIQPVEPSDKTQMPKIPEIHNLLQNLSVNTILTFIYNALNSLNQLINQITTKLIWEL
jgi:hypothetical protein